MDLEERRVLLKEVFEKVKKESGQSTVNAYCTHLSNELNNLGFPSSSRNLQRHYKACFSEGEIPKIGRDYLKSLVNYLGYENYLDYRTKNIKQVTDLIDDSDKKETEDVSPDKTYLKQITLPSKKVLKIGSLFLASLTLGSVYIENSLDLNFQQMSLLSFNKMKKIRVCEKTAFFDNQGKVQVFYYGRKGDFTFYDRQGEVPDKPNKFNRPITRHIIFKYKLNEKPCD